VIVRRAGSNMKYLKVVWGIAVWGSMAFVTWLAVSGNLKF